MAVPVEASGVDRGSAPQLAESSAGVPTSGSRRDSAQRGTPAGSVIRGSNGGGIPPPRPQSNTPSKSIISTVSNTSHSHGQRLHPQHAVAPTRRRKKL